MHADRLYVNQPECSKSNKNGVQTLTVTLLRHATDLVAFMDTRKLQHALSTHYHNYLHHQFTSQSSAQDLTVFNNTYGNHTAAYLQEIPSEPSLTLSNSEMLICLCHYLNTSHYVQVEAQEVAPDVYGDLDI